MRDAADTLGFSITAPMQLIITQIREKPIWQQARSHQMNRMILNQLSQDLADLQVACQEQCSLDTETEALFHDLAAEIASYSQYYAGEQDNQILYLKLLRYFVKIRTFLDSQLSSNELQRKAEDLLGVLADKEMFSSTPTLFKANQLRDEAWRNEQDAITKLESWIANKPTAPAQDQTHPNSIDLTQIKYDPDAIPIWELAARLAAKVPDEEWAKLPTDLARNFDFYQQ
jgi:hypothetical protein